MKNYAAHAGKNIASTPNAINHSNAAVYGVADATVLDRFLVLGTEGGTYYVAEKEQTLEIVPSIKRLMEVDHRWVVDHTVAFSDAGRGVKNDPALFVMAMAASVGTADQKAYALAQMPKVARIGTHILQFVAMVDKLRGWSRGLRRGISEWYTDKPVDQLAFQLVKYQNRADWRQGDVLRQAHPTPVNTAMEQVFRFAVGKSYDATGIKWLEAYDALQAAGSAKDVVRLIEQYKAFQEIVPTQWLKDAEVWRALLPNLGITALVRNLGRLTSLGVLNGMSDADVYVQNALRNEDLIRKGRLHPLTVLNGWMAYSGSAERKGSLEWRAIPQVMAAMEDAFYLSFGAVTPTGKRFVYGLDVSASMGSQISGLSITCAQAVAAMSMLLARTEQRYRIMAFNNGIEDIRVTPKTDFKSMFKAVDSINGGGTNCALPMTWAQKEKVEADAFVVLTDNETNDYQWRAGWGSSASGVSPAQALMDYRQATGINAKLIVVGMTSSGFSIADPKDGGMVDVIGFDTATPNMIGQFAQL